MWPHDNFALLISSSGKLFKCGGSGRITRRGRRLAGDSGADTSSNTSSRVWTYFRHADSCRCSDCTAEEKILLIYDFHGRWLRWNCLTRRILDIHIVCIVLINFLFNSLRLQAHFHLSFAVKAKCCCFLFCYYLQVFVKLQMLMQTPHGHFILNERKSDVESEFPLMILEKDLEPYEMQSVDRAKLTANWHHAGEKELIRVRRQHAPR